MTQAVLLGFAAVLALPASHAATPLYNGYTIITERPVALDLRQVVYQRVQGQSILEGFLTLLAGTGWRLAERAAADPEIDRLYEQPYPESQRDIGPSELGTVLERLAGPAWQLVEDPVNRRVSFERRWPYRPAVVEGERLENR